MGSPHYPFVFRICFRLLKSPQQRLVLSQSFSHVSSQTLPTKKTFSQMFQESSYLRQLDTGQQAHALMITSGFLPTVFVTNCLMHMYIKCSKMDYAHKVFNQMILRDTVSWNAIIFGYSGCGLMGLAKDLFDTMPERDVISWNSLISGYLQNGNYWKAIELFLEMEQMGVKLDRTTFAVVFKLCSNLENLELGIQMHALAVRTGFDRDVVTGSALVDMYSKCKRLEESNLFFLEMPEKNSVSWSAIIAGYVQNDELIRSLEVFKVMQAEGVGVSQSTYASVFRSCAGLLFLYLGRQLHAHAFKTSFSLDTIVGTAVLDMYAKCNSLDDARSVFFLLPNYNLQSWNAIIVGHARNDQNLEAVQLFQLLQRSGFGADEVSLSGVFSACAGVEGFLEGSQVHGLAIKLNLDSGTCVSNAILDMYGKCGALPEACRMFYDMKIRDSVSLNAIITAYEQNRQSEETLSHYDQMLSWGMQPDVFTYGSILKACASLQDLKRGKEIHNRIIKSGFSLDSFVGSTLVDMYCKSGNVEEAEKIHNRIGMQTIVSWNAIISGFVTQKRSEEAQDIFSKMLVKGLKPDNFTYATILDTCANLATVGLGKQIHSQILKHQLQTDVYISSTLVDMYSKCGNMQDSLLMFEKMKERDFVSWNAIICGYSQHGLGLEAIKMFKRMQQENVKPNHATFIAVLRACGYVGLFDEGLKYFDSMLNQYGLDPQLEHYSCMVDIVGRSRGVHDALKLILEMPFEADAVIWRALLSVCKIHGNVEVAEHASKSILQLDPEDSAAYVLLSNIYAEAGRWGEVSKMRRVMRQNRLKKEPGCSWIEVKSELHSFLVGDKAHPRWKVIYEMLNELIVEMKWVGYKPNLIFDDEEGVHS
ncbi:pentatricopeptide repeat-containing protein At3g02330, mitochondrial [Aristolochia californica]|uniref:pentatricopeptide repeat-containing protein At3g02330, mitochondrial n=1 Tax=Aristolochia californica TaxID=171875 RepID=UPI0035DD1931